MTNKDIDIAPELGAELFLEETTEEAVSRIVAQDPQKHGVTLEQRKARATELARRMIPTEDEQARYERRVREIDGDPDAMMVGNKPRYTMDEDGNVKDHETGEVHRAAVNQDVSEARVPATRPPVEPDAAAMVDCEHPWPDDPQPETRCPQCGIRFVEWANS